MSVSLFRSVAFTSCCEKLAVASSAFAQHISVGIKAGVPLTDVVEAKSGELRFQAQTKRYTIGPVVDIGLPLGFGVEFGAIYKRFDQKSIAITITAFTTMNETDESQFPSGPITPQFSPLGVSELQQP
jgi:hypothetical protein